MDEKIQALQSIYEYIRRVDDTILESANQIRSGFGFKDVKDFAEGLRYAYTGLIQTADIHKIRLIDVQELKGLLSDIADGLENGDFGLVADVFEYEFKPLISQWREELDGFFAENDS